MKTNLLTVLLASGTVIASCQSNTSSTDSERTSATPADSATTAAVAADTVAKVGNPKLLHTLDEAHNTPDGMALAPNGSIILSVPNLANNSYPAVLMEMTDTSLKPYLTTLPPEPTTKKAAPMDLAFGPDGNLYYAENQYENNKNFNSRLMRVVVENGKPGAVETVVDNFALANAVVWNGNKIYVTDSQWDMPNDDKGSAVLVFTLDELNKGIVHLKPKTMDAHVLATFTTKVNETGVDNGADGLDYDSKGDFYTGSFGDGTMYKMTLKPDGTLAKKEAMQLTGEKITCVDGLVIDRATDKVYVCNSRENAIQVINLKNNSVTTLAKNGDTNGANGLLDQPAEVLLNGKRLYVTNFDKPEKNFVNTKSDAPHTMSVIDLQ